MDYLSVRSVFRERFDYKWFSLDRRLFVRYTCRSNFPSHSLTTSVISCILKVGEF